MFDVSHLANQADTYVYLGYESQLSWQTWQKPRGKTMCSIVLIGCGGNGGNGVTGAVGSAAGGGGGGSGGFTQMVLPLLALPDMLYLCLRQGSALASYVSAEPFSSITTYSPELTVIAANGGTNGGNGSGATRGAGGAGGAAAGVGVMYYGYMGACLLATGQNGSNGGGATGGTTNGVNLAPLPALPVTGGTGGGGLTAAGTKGGDILGSGSFPSLAGGAVVAGPTLPANPGSGGYMPLSGVFRFYGGTGSSSTHPTATGSGLSGAFGGNGAPGCGGGGGGGRLTGSAVAGGGRGGPALCVITCW